MTLHHEGQAFTDDDLKRLKDLLLKGHLYSDLVLDKDLLALIARLEAAEKIVQDKIDRGWGDHPLVKAWAKEAGK